MSLEVSADLDIMAEARRRPRPSQLHPEANADDDIRAAAEGLSADSIQVRDCDDQPAQVHSSSAETRPLTSPNDCATPIFRIVTIGQSAVHLIHRLNVGRAFDTRADDAYHNVKTFCEQHDSFYKSIVKSRPLSPPDPKHVTNTPRWMDLNDAVKRQRDLCQHRKELDEGLRALNESDLQRLRTHALYADDPGEAVSLPISALISPAEYARSLVVRHGICHNVEQYAAVFLA